MREHKKETKCGFGGVSMYDQQGIEKKLADMARKGWLIEEMQNAFFWNYRRIEPKELHFAAVYAAAKPEGPDPSTKTSVYSLFFFMLISIPPPCAGINCNKYSPIHRARNDKRLGAHVRF